MCAETADNQRDINLETVSNIFQIILNIVPTMLLVIFTRIGLVVALMNFGAKM